MKNLITESSSTTPQRLPITHSPKIPESARKIITNLQARGFIALFAGGCVRDFLLYRDPYDWDVATDATPEQIAEIFPRTVAVGAAFGVIVVIGDDNENYEVASLRADGEYRDGRHPESVQFSTPAADAARRDFTVNALFYDLGANEIIDYVGGIADLKRRIIRAVGEPIRRFTEDRLRMLRAIRLATQLNFTIDHDTWTALRATPFVGVSAERIAVELEKIFTATAAAHGLELLAESGLLADTKILPEVAAMRGVKQPAEFHPEGDVFQHTLAMLKILPERLRLLSADKFTAAVLAWAVVLHDVAKPVTKIFTDRWRFNRHDEIGAAMSEQILRRLKQPAKIVASVRDLVLRHMHFIELKKMREAKRRRFLQDPFFPLHLELHYLDCAGSHGILTGYDYAAAALAEERARPPVPPTLLTGRDLIRLGFKPGAFFKTILTAAQDAALEGKISTPAEAIMWVKSNY